MIAYFFPFPLLFLHKFFFFYIIFFYGRWKWLARNFSNQKWKRTNYQKKKNGKDPWWGLIYSLFSWLQEKVCTTIDFLRIFVMMFYFRKVITCMHNWSVRNKNHLLFSSGTLTQSRTCKLFYHNYNNHIRFFFHLFLKVKLHWLFTKKIVIPYT